MNPVYEKLMNCVKTVSNTIVGKLDKNYSYQIVRLKGEVDDTIKVKPCDSCEIEKLKMENLMQLLWLKQV